jgi:hypothetical protein
MRDASISAAQAACRRRSAGGACWPPSASRPPSPPPRSRPKAASTSTGSTTSRCRPWAPCSTTIRCASRLGRHVGAADHQVAHRAVGQARQHQRRALVRPTPTPGQTVTLPRSLSPISMPARMPACAWSRLMAAVTRRCACRGRSCASAAGRAAAASAATPQSTTVTVELLARAKTVSGRWPVSSMRTVSCGLRPARLAGPGCRRPPGRGRRQTPAAAGRATRLERVLHQPQAHGQRFQLAQAAAGFVARCSLSRRRARARVGGGADQRTVGNMAWVAV